MTATVAGIHLGIDTHANRPAANTVPDGSIYSCSTHNLVYKSNFAGNSWATWATLGGAAFSGARVYNSGNIPLTSGVETVLTFDTERYDTDAYHDTGSNTDRLTVPATLKYHIGVNVRVTATPGDPSYVVLQVNGSTVIGLNFIANNGSIPMGHIDVDYALSSGDYVKAFVFVNSSSKNATANGNYSPEFWIHAIH